MKHACWVLVLALHGVSASVGFAADWIDVRSPNFRVIANVGEKRAREVASELERIRLVFRNALVNMLQDPGLPIVAFAVRDEESFRELVPEYWEREGAKPAGVFLRGSDKHFIVVRVDTPSEYRYRIIYHEYFHLLLGLNLQRVPVWLNEGLAEFWEQTRIRGSRVDMGTPNWSHVDFLKRQRMMPLHELLAMERNPHDSDPERVGIFYAQAWALTHLLLLGDQKGGPTPSVGAYMDLVNEGGDPRQSFVSVFGDLDAMEQKLERYVGQARMMALQMESPEKIDGESFVVTKLTEAAAAGARGNFLVSGTRPDAAVPLLERALELDPEYGLALESMGFYHYRKQESAQAREWFSKASRVDSESFLCHYYLALLMMNEGPDGEAQAKESLGRAISLNPKFAPAYADLGRLFAETGVRLEGAYGLAVKAVELEPDNAWFWINLGRILLQMEKPNDARAAAGRALGAARSEGLGRMVDDLQNQIENYERRVAAANAGGPVAPMVEDPRRGSERDERRIEGRFVELRCRDRENSFDFVIESEGRSHVFRTDAPGTIQLVENGESVIRDMNCGPQDARVVVVYVPSKEGLGSDVQGELRILEFLP